MVRIDRTEKLKRRGTTHERVVKCSLNGLLYLLPIEIDKIKDALKIRGRQCSLRTHNASIALNLLIRRLFDNQDDVLQVDIPEFWDQTFIRQLMLGTTTAIQPIKIISDLYKKYPYLLSSDPRSFGDRNIYSAAAKKFGTNVKNHLFLNLPGVIKRYLYDCCDLSVSEAVEALYLIHGWKTKITKQTKSEPIDVNKVQSIAQNVRTILKLEDGAAIGKQWLKSEDNLGSILRFFVFVSRSLESKALTSKDDDAKKCKLFSILPICRIKSHFITIDTFTFYHILKDVDIIKSIPKTFDHEITDAMWKSIFKINKLQGKNMTFTGTIETDGVAACVHFTYPKAEECVKEGDKEFSFKGKRVLAVDPGRTNIFQMVEQLEDGSFKSYGFSRRRYYKESGMNIATQKNIHWQTYVKDELKQMSKNSSKSMLMSTFQKYLETMQSVWTSLWNLYTKDKWSSQRLKLYGGKKRSFAKFFNTLKIDKNTVFAYGSAKFAPGGKGEVSVPTTSAYKECSFRAPVFPIDEFRTTIVHWKDDSLLKKVMKPGKPGKLVAVRGLSWCDSTNCKDKFVNRDLNAAINILRCANLPKRPESLTRTKDKEKYVQSIGKIIKC